jgi:putative transposase
MVGYRRNRIEGGTFFFTLALADRRSKALVDHVGALRAAFRATRQERPFTIDALVVLPDHLHSILTLPPGDADFAGRWRRIKGNFSTRLLAAGIAIRRHPNGDLHFGNDDTGNTLSATTRTSSGMSITSITIR